MNRDRERQSSGEPEQDVALAVTVQRARLCWWVVEMCMLVDLMAASNAARLDDRMRGFGCAGMKRRVETFSFDLLIGEEVHFPGLRCIASDSPKRQQR